MGIHRVTLGQSTTRTDTCLLPHTDYSTNHHVQHHTEPSLKAEYLAQIKAPTLQHIKPAYPA